MNKKAQEQNPSGRRPSNPRLLLWLFVFGIGMFGFGYLMVPLYNVLCKATGINGKTGGAVGYEVNEPIDKSRMVTVEFIGSRNMNMPWEFKPNDKRVKIHPGEYASISFHVKNNSGKEMIIQAIPSVAPGDAARYVKKTECFCFTRQTVDKDYEGDWPVLFHLDRDLPKNITTVTVSYTLFDVSHIGKSLKRGTLGHLN